MHCSSDFARTLERELAEVNEALALIQAHEAENLESDSIIASCNCQVKAGESKYHKPGCKYRILCERNDARIALSGRTVSCQQCEEMARKLDEKDAQIVALRSALNRIERSSGSSEIVHCCQAALSTPAPACVPVEDVEPLVDALRDKECFSHPSNALASFLAKHPLP